MAFPGETLGLGAPETCEDCGITVKEQVCQSAAGYYIGSMCNCGPYTRESGYYKTKEEAQKDLETGDYPPRI